MKKFILNLTVILLTVLICSNSLAAGPKKIKKCMTITKSGSYVVTKNLQAKTKTNGNCITIDADFVTLDLNGFTLTGLGIADTYGVWDNDTAHSGLFVYNGMITNFDYGIMFNDADGGRIEMIMATSNLLRGIHARKGFAVIDNIAQSNGDVGIYAGEGSTIIGNMAKDNAYMGIEIAGSSTVTKNTATGNGNIGILVTNSGSTITRNTARGNNIGMYFQCPCSVIGNTSTSNSSSNYSSTGSGCNFINNLFP